MADEEFEYQYDASETSTFLVELDLSTLNGIKRDMPNRKYSNRRRKAAAEVEEDEEERDANDEDDADFDETRPESSEHRQRGVNNTLQFLDLASSNPMVAYKGNFYSCTWHDMIGTNMFYSLPHQGIEHTPERQTRAYNLLGTSRVKLVGQRAKVYETASARKRQRIDNDPPVRQNTKAALSHGGSQSDAEPRPAKPDSATDAQEQADFLAKLTEIQRSRQTTSDGTSLVDRNETTIVDAPAIGGHQENHYPDERAVS